MPFAARACTFGECGAQKALACAAKHLWYSTMWGGIMGEDGRYDAFATLMEVGEPRAGGSLCGWMGNSPRDAAIW
jgi:hypothetical protein